MSQDQRMENLEFKIVKLDEIIVDLRRTHFNHVILDYDLSRSEVNKLHGLLEELSAQCSETSAETVKAKINTMIPSLENAAPFLEVAIRSLNEDGRYPEVFQLFYK